MMGRSSLACVTSARISCSVSVGGVDAQNDAAEVFSHALADGGAICLVGYVAGETEAVFAFACPVGALGADEVVEGG